MGALGVEEEVGVAKCCFCARGDEDCFGDRR